MLHLHKNFWISAALAGLILLSICPILSAQEQTDPATATAATAPAATSTTAAQTPQTPAAPAMSAPAAATGVPTALTPPMGQGAIPPAADLSPLRKREQELLDELALLKTDDANYAERFQSIGAELRDIQLQMQEQPIAPQAFPNMPQGMNAPGMNAVPFGGMPNPASGLNGNLPAGAFAPQGAAPVQGNFDPMNDPALLKQIKEELTFQLKQIQQTLTMLGPQDEALSTTLKEQQADLLKQLQDVNGKLGEPADSTAAAPTAPGAPAIPGDPATALQGADPTAPINVEAFTDKMAKINQAATLLQEAGLPELANAALNQAAAGGGAPLADNPSANADWYNPGGAKAEDIAEMKGAMAEMKAQLDAVTAALADINTQLKLLSRQSVE